MGRSSSAGSNLVFFLLGAATGAAITLLYAPQEGEATRRLIGEKASNVKNKASEVTTNVAQSARDTYGSVLDKAQDMLSRGQRAANKATNRMTEKAQETIDEVSPA
jgi:gas vesicle protein